MKKSNKLILGSIFMALVVVTVTHLILYGQYHRGHITTVKLREAEQMVVYHPSAFHYISLSGTVWVNIIPSDSPMVEMSNNGNSADLVGITAKQPFHGESKGPDLRVSGDTLYITGENTIPIHRPYADWYYRHSFLPINIYAHQPQGISITNGQLMLVGAKDSAILNSAVLTATNSTVWIGEFNEPRHGEPSKEFFDSLNIQLDNTILLLNRPAVITRLHARLDNNSELNDRSANIAFPEVSTSNDSRVSFTGANIKKTTINVH